MKENVGLSLYRQGDLLMLLLLCLFPYCFREQVRELVGFKYSVSMYLWFAILMAMATRVGEAIC